MKARAKENAWKAEQRPQAQGVQPSSLVARGEPAGQLNGDREVVLVAVSNKGDTLEFASEQLKGNRDLVVAAVSNNGYALRHASEQLESDREVVQRIEGDLLLCRHYCS